MFSMLIVVGCVISIWFDVIFMMDSFEPEKSDIRNLTKNCFASFGFSIFIEGGVMV